MKSMTREEFQNRWLDDFTYWLYAAMLRAGQTDAEKMRWLRSTAIPKLNALLGTVYDEHIFPKGDVPLEWLKERFRRIEEGIVSLGKADQVRAAAPIPAPATVANGDKK